MKLNGVLQLALVGYVTAAPMASTTSSSITTGPYIEDHAEDYTWAWMDARNSLEHPCRWVMDKSDIFRGTNITDESVLEVSQQINRIALHFYHAAFRSASDICNIMREYSTLDASETSEVLAEGVNLQADIIRDVYDALNLLTAAMRTSTFILSPYQSEALDWALLYVVIAVERSAGPVEDFYEIYRNTSTAALQSAIPSLQMAVDSADQLHIDAAVGSTDASSPGK